MCHWLLTRETQELLDLSDMLLYSDVGKWLESFGYINDPRSVLAVKTFAYDSRTKYPSHTVL